MNIQDTYYLVVDHGRLGRETIIDWENCSKADAIKALVSGEHTRVLEVHCIDRNFGRWSDMSAEIAQEIADDLQAEPTGDLLDFLEQHLGCQTVAEICREMEAA